MTETLIAQLARPVTFIHRNRNHEVVDTAVYPAGTEVYVERLGRKEVNVRVPRTLWTQSVYLSTLLVP